MKPGVAVLAVLNNGYLFTQSLGFGLRTQMRRITQQRSDWLEWRFGPQERLSWLMVDAIEDTIATQT